MTMYTTWGQARGDCGHVHRTLAGAERCLQRDQSACASLPRREGLEGAYSDRQIRAIESRHDLDNYNVTRGPGEPLPQDDSEELEWR